jgi:hypothetical protein
MNRKQLLLIASGGGALSAIGAFMPWATFSDSGIGAALRAVGRSASVSGMDGDGKLVLVLCAIGLVATVAALLGKSLPVSTRGSLLSATICFGLSAAICVFDAMGISAPASVGMGLWLGVIGSIAAAAAGFLAWKKTSGAKEAAATAS